MTSAIDSGEFNEKFLNLLTKEKYASTGLTEKIRKELENKKDSIETVLESFSVFHKKEIYPSIAEGRKTVIEGTVTFEQFAVALYDEVTGISSLMQSLEKRGWLDN